MADVGNADHRFGLIPLRHKNGAPYNGAGNWYYVPSTDNTALYIGDPVVVAGSADANGYPTVTRATAAGGNYMLGPVMGVARNAPALGGNFLSTGSIDRTIIYRAGSTAAYVFVADDPDLVFKIQEDSDTSTLSADSVGLNADIVFTHSGSTVTGRSGCELDSDTANTTNTLQLRILRLHDTPDNLIGDNAVWEVSINLHSQRYLTGV